MPLMLHYRIFAFCLNQHRRRGRRAAVGRRRGGRDAKVNAHLRLFHFFFPCFLSSLFALDTRSTSYSIHTSQKLA